MSDAPKKRSWWRHTNGNIYQVVEIANRYTERPDQYPVTVIYKGANGRVWCRPLKNWYRSMSEAGG